MATCRRTLLLLDLPNEVLDDIAAHMATWKPTSGLTSLSMVNKRFRSVCMPVLFSCVRIVKRKSEIMKPLMKLLASPHVLESIRTLNINQSDKQPKHEMIWWPSSPIVELLPLIPRLSELQVSECIHTLSIAGVCLPTVKSLDLHASHRYPMDRDTDSIWKVFPSLETLSITPDYIFRDNISKGHIGPLDLVRLKTLRYQPLFWCAPTVEWLYEAAPHIEFLLIRGEVQGHSISSIIDSFAKFKGLKRLAIETHQNVQDDLDLWYYGVMQGRPDDEADHDREYSLVLEEGRRLKEEHVLNEDPAELAEKFFDAIDTLQEICLADYKCSLAFIPVRDDGGVLKGVERTYCAFRGAEL